MTVAAGNASGGGGGGGTAGAAPATPRSPRKKVAVLDDVVVLDGDGGEDREYPSAELTEAEVCRVVAAYAQWMSGTVTAKWYGLAQALHELHIASVALTEDEVAAVTGWRPGSAAMSYAQFRRLVECCKGDAVLHNELLRHEGGGGGGGGGDASHTEALSLFFDEHTTAVPLQGIDSILGAVELPTPFRGDLEAGTFVSRGCLQAYLERQADGGLQGAQRGDPGGGEGGGAAAGTGAAGGDEAGARGGGGGGGGAPISKFRGVMKLNTMLIGAGIFGAAKREEGDGAGAGASEAGGGGGGGVSPLASADAPLPAGGGLAGSPPGHSASLSPMFLSGARRRNSVRNFRRLSAGDGGAGGGGGGAVSGQDGRGGGGGGVAGGKGQQDSDPVARVAEESAGLRRKMAAVEESIQRLRHNEGSRAAAGAAAAAAAAAAGEGPVRTTTEAAVAQMSRAGAGAGAVDAETAAELASVERGLRREVRRAEAQRRRRRRRRKQGQSQSRRQEGEDARPLRRLTFEASSAATTTTAYEYDVDLSLCTTPSPRHLAGGPLTLPPQATDPAVSFAERTDALVAAGLDMVGEGTLSPADVDRLVRDCLNCQGRRACGNSRSGGRKNTSAEGGVRGGRSVQLRARRSPRRRRRGGSEESVAGTGTGGLVLPPMVGRAVACSPSSLLLPYCRRADGADGGVSAAAAATADADAFGGTSPTVSTRGATPKPSAVAAAAAASEKARRAAQQRIGYRATQRLRAPKEAARDTEEKRHLLNRLMMAAEVRRPRDDDDDDEDGGGCGGGGGGGAGWRAKPCRETEQCLEAVSTFLVSGRVGHLRQVRAARAAREKTREPAFETAPAPSRQQGRQAYMQF